ncbi:signal peptidase I [Enterococcus crotali]|uniref:signal peptidase I n=1 Tax=Enterococcus crotali TaxID=1453587 RepID=UPI00046FF123|nr:signal peptidase I [Enterococcus crotali]
MEQRRVKRHRSSSDERPRKKKPSSSSKSRQKKSHNKSSVNGRNQKSLQSLPRQKTQKKKQRSNVQKNRSSLKSKRLKKFLDLLFYIITLGLICMSILFAFSDDQNKTIFGYRIFNVLTNSMAPNERDQKSGGFYAGDVIIVKDIQGDTAKEGEVITYRPSMKSEAFLTHRVVKKLDHLDKVKGTYYITKGDNNDTEDLPISEKQVVGKKIIVFPKVGAVLKFIRKNFAVSVIFMLSVFGFILVIKMYIFSK